MTSQLVELFRQITDSDEKQKEKDEALSQRKKQRLQAVILSYMNEAELEELIQAEGSTAAKKEYRRQYDRYKVLLAEVPPVSQRQARQADRWKQETSRLQAGRAGVRIWDKANDVEIQDYRLNESDGAGIMVRLFINSGIKTAVYVKGGAGYQKQARESMLARAVILAHMTETEFKELLSYPLIVPAKIEYRRQRQILQQVLGSRVLS